MRVAKIAIIGTTIDKYFEVTLLNALKRIKECEKGGVGDWVDATPAKISELSEFDTIIGSDILSGVKARNLVKKISEFYWEHGLDIFTDNQAFVNIDDKKSLSQWGLCEETNPDLFKAMAKRGWKFRKVTFPKNGYYRGGWIMLEIELAD